MAVAAETKSKPLSGIKLKLPDSWLCAVGRVVKLFQTIRIYFKCQNFHELKKMRHGSLRVLGLSAIPPKATCKTEPSGLIIP